MSLNISAGYPEHELRINLFVMNTGLLLAVPILCIQMGFFEATVGMCPFLLRNQL